MRRKFILNALCRRYGVLFYSSFPPVFGAGSVAPPAAQLHLDVGLWGGQLTSPDICAHFYSEELRVDPLKQSTDHPATHVLPAEALTLFLGCCTH